MSPAFDWQAWQENAGAEWRVRQRARRAVTNRLARGGVFVGTGLLGLFTPELPGVAWRAGSILFLVMGAAELVRATRARRRGGAGVP